MDIKQLRHQLYCTVACLGQLTLELLLELLEQGEGIRHASGEAGQDLASFHAPHLGRTRLHDRVLHRDLSVSTDRHVIAAANAQYRRRSQ